MSNYDNTQPRQWQPRNEQQAPQQNNGYQQPAPSTGGYNNGGGGGYQNRPQNNNGGSFTKQERRTGKSTFSKPLGQPGICRNGGHPIPAGTVGVRFDYDNRDQNDKALMECPEHFAEFKARMGWTDGPRQDTQQQAQNTVQNGFGGGQWADNDGNGTF